MGKEQNVSLDFFKNPAVHKDVSDIVFRNDNDAGIFYLGLLPDGEFTYGIKTNPDVYFKNLDIEEVYYEPYRTFIRLKAPSKIEISFPGSGDKLYVKGTL